MCLFLPNIILRHRKENLKKCSLRGLECREDFVFFTYPKDSLPPLNGYILLTLGAPPLTKGSVKESLGIFLIDGTWRYAQKMQKDVEKKQPFLLQRSLPSGINTAYPRRQTLCSDPTAGLASIEALYASLHIMGKSKEGLLNHYPFKDIFLEKNRKFFEAYH